MNNFKTFVPAALQEKIKSLVTLAIDFVNNQGENVISCENISTIEGNYVSGWMPSQDGGFSADCFISGCEGYEICESQKHFNNGQYHECMREFCQENDIDESVELNDLQQDRFYDYQNSWNEGNEALLQFQCFVDYQSQEKFYQSKNPQDTVTIRLSINFNDAPYYREKYATDLYQAVYSVDEFIDMNNEEILKLVVIDKEA